jgi:hypothetical protein
MLRLLRVLGLPTRTSHKDGAVRVEVDLTRDPGAESAHQNPPWESHSRDPSKRKEACRAMRIAIIGPPGAGKSAQAKRIARSLPYPKYSPRRSSGELIRAEVEAATELGRGMEGYYDRGERVPDEIVLPLVLPRLRRAGGFMLDNFPATVAQARALDGELDGHGAGGLSRASSEKVAESPSLEAQG